MKKEKKWHPNFIKYMEEIINNKNYKGLPIKKKNNGSYSWVAMKTTEIGKQRIEWCKKKAIQLGIPTTTKGFYSKVMFEIHPTKKKICQVCGKEMSLYYIYPTKNILKSLNKEFNILYSQTDDICFITEDLIKKGVEENKIKEFFLNKLGTFCTDKDLSIKEIILKMEILSRNEGRRFLSPGAMSDFPDRFDGFHTYNLCCRKKEDKGRNDNNMKTYSKDRRAYEYFNDGNLRAADKFMKSKFFENNSADHIGPISLGFVHDSRYIVPLSRGENSAKRDRLLKKDIEKIIEIYQKTQIYPMSWYSKEIWEFIVKNYQNKNFPIEIFSDTLKQNMVDFMYILKQIKDTNNGENFIYEILIKPKLSYFEYDYSFDSNGNIIQKKIRKKNRSF